MDHFPAERFALFRKSLSQGRRKFLRRLGAWSERWHNEPLRGIFFQSGYQTCTHQRRFAAARGAQYQQQPWVTLSPQSVQQFAALQNLRITSEEDRRVLLLEGAQPWIGAGGGAPLASSGSDNPLGAKSIPEAAIAAFGITAEIDELIISEDRWQLGCIRPGINLHNEHLLTLHSGKSDFSETPLRSDIVVTTKSDNGSTGAQLGIKSALPTGPSLNPDFRVEI